MQPDGVIVQFGGQTPLNLARALEAAGVPIIGTSVESIDAGRGPRAVPALVIDRLGLKQPANGIAARRASRPGGSPSGSATRSSSGPASCSAAGRWRSSTTRRSSTRYMAEAVEVAPGQPVLIDKFLEDAIEVDVDAVCDGERTRRRRRDGAHRGGRHPLRRLGLRDPAVSACSAEVVAGDQASRRTRWPRRCRSAG